MKNVAMTAGALLFAASAALHANPVEELFKGVDANQDGRISQTESTINPTLEENFAALDKNRDGFLTPDEFQPANDKAES
ncbi:MAG: hypothetical protein HWE39_22165 [Oceanospirillaceae bacterium]|nr:hypothetical protein [Oceanospirillaceae bacterium]